MTLKVGDEVYHPLSDRSGVITAIHPTTETDIAWADIEVRPHYGFSAPLVELMELRVLPNLGAAHVPTVPHSKTSG